MVEPYILYRDDLNHSNKPVQYCTNKSMKHYQGVMGEEGCDRKRVFLGSDGCSIQIKSHHMVLYEAIPALMVDLSSQSPTL